MNVVKIQEIADQVRGVSYKPIDLHDSLDDDSVILLRANNIDDGKINFDDIVFVDKSKVSKEQYLKKGDILVCASSGSKQLVGKAASVDFDQECTFGAFCKVIRPQKVFAEYVGKYFQSNIYRIKISTVAIGANINNIRNEHIDSLELNVYKEEENKAIVQVISCVQSIIENRKQELQKLDELIKARFVELFGDPVGNTNSLPLKQLNDVCLKITDGTHDTPPRYDNGYLLITGKNIRSTGIIFDEVEYVSKEDHKIIYDRCNPEYGDVLYTNIGVNYGTACFNSLDYEFSMKNVALLKPKKDTLNGYYLWACLNIMRSHILSMNQVGGAQTFMGLATIKKITIPVPSIELQNQFAAFVEQTDKSKVKVQQSLDETQILMDSLMQKYFG